MISNKKTLSKRVAALVTAGAVMAGGGLMGTGIVSLDSARGLSAAFGASSAPDVEETVKAPVFSAQYEGYLPNEWFKTSKLNGALTRKDAAYLMIYAYSKAAGSSPEWIEYKTDLSDTNDLMLSRAVDLGFLSVGKDMKFNGANTVTQQELMVMMTKVLIKTGKYVKPTKAINFTDQSSIASWAKESVQFASEKQWLVWVKGNKFEPTKAVTLGRSIALMDQVLVHYGVYAKPKAANTADTYDVKGFKVKKPNLSELEVSVTPQGKLKVFFSGVIKDRSKYDYKAVIKQLTDMLDSNPAVGQDARSSLLQIMDKSWDETLQVYTFTQEYFIALDDGQITYKAPAEPHIAVKAGKVLYLEIAVE